MQTHSQTGTEIPSLILLWFALQLVHLVSLDLGGSVPAWSGDAPENGVSDVWFFPPLKGITTQTVLTHFAG